MMLKVKDTCGITGLWGELAGQGRKRGKRHERVQQAVQYEEQVRQRGSSVGGGTS